ncbi:MAG: hypothetical protein ACI80K_000288 [Paracoccaceae bacterium]
MRFLGSGVARVPLLLRFTCAFLLGAVPMVQAQRADVDGELWIRAAARQLARGGGAPARRPGGHPAWVSEVSWLEAYVRAGIMLDPADPVLLGEAEVARPEVAAARLRVTPSGVSDFEGRLSRGLRAPFASLREAAIDRLVLWTLEPQAEAAPQEFIVRELEQGALAGNLTDQLMDLALRSGRHRRLGRLLSLPMVAGRLASSDREGWTPAFGLLEDIIAAPLTLDELQGLRRSEVDPGTLACLELVAQVRDGLEVVDPEVGLMVDLIRGGASPAGAYSSEVDEAVEAFIDSLLIRGRHAQSAVVQGLGEALAASVLEGPGATSGGTAGGPDSRDRCVRAAARLLSPTRQLKLGLAYPEDAGVELWLALDRSDHWGEGTELLEALRPWLTHPAEEVRETAVRAVGQRYAYGGRGDFEPLLVDVLADADPTLRSITFAWLVKSNRRLAPDDELDAVLRRAWDGEGHGGEGPVLTGRQARWLAQLPRDRTAHAFRDALLGLLSLSGASQEVVGAGSLELLGSFGGDEEVFLRVGLLAERSIVGLEAAGHYDARLPFDSAAARAVRILQRVNPDATESLLDGLLSRSMHLMHGAGAPAMARPQLPKTAALLLGKTAGGRARLARYVDPGVPRRVRFEAALQLVLAGSDSTNDEASARVLMGDFDGVDGALRLRALEALGQALVPSADPFLVALTGLGNDQAERGAAIEALGRRRSLPALMSVMAGAIEAAGPDAGTIDAAAYAARALRHAAGKPGAPLALELAAAQLRELSGALASGHALATVRGALLESTGVLVVGELRRGANLAEGPGEEVLGQILAAPLRQAGLAAQRGFGRQRRSEAQFLWASELAALKTLGADSGLFRAALGDEARWGRLDGRLLLAIAHLAASAGLGDLSRELSEAAIIALRGEGVAHDHERRLAEASWLHAAGSLAPKGVPAGETAGETAGDGDPAAARTLAGLLSAFRAGRLGRGVLQAIVPAIPRPVAAAHAAYWRAAAGPRATVDSWSRLK